MTELVKFESKKVRDEVVKQLEAMQAQKFASLPEKYKESAFFAIEKIASLEGIESVQPESITKALLKTFSAGLDYQKNHCYFFVQNDKNSPTGKSLRFGWQYQGLVSKAKQELSVVDVFPVLVNESDVFSTHYEMGALIIDQHVPTFEGEIKGGYCVVEFSDHRFIVKYYPKSELDKRREKSMAKNGQFWKWEREMYEKTLINAVLKRMLETSPDTNADDLYSEPDETVNRQTIQIEAIEQPDLALPTATTPEPQQQFKI